VLQWRKRPSTLTDEGMESSEVIRFHFAASNEAAGNGSAAAGNGSEEVIKSPRNRK
jgi:hypothetical protein